MKDHQSTIRRFEDLIVWQMAIALVKRIYLVTNRGELKRDFGLKDQMRRASVSVPTNIAEDSNGHRAGSTCSF